MPKSVEEWIADIDAQINIYNNYRTRGRKIVDKYRDDFKDRDRSTFNAVQP